MKRLVIYISLLLILTAFTNSNKHTKTIARIKTPKTIALIYSNNLYFIQVKLNNIDANLLVDTGAVSSVLDINQANDYKFKIAGTGASFVGIGGESRRYTVSYYKIVHETTSLIVPAQGANLEHVVNSFRDNGMEIVGILGSDFLRNNDAVIDYKHKQLIIYY